MITLGLKPKTARKSKRSKPVLDLFVGMCQDIAAFMKGHNGRDFKAFFAHEGSSLSLYLMTESEAYDFDLSAKLADFAGPYIERGLLDSVSLIPASSPEELAALFDPDSALRIEIENA